MFDHTFINIVIVVLAKKKKAKLRLWCRSTQATCQHGYLKSSQSLGDLNQASTNCLLLQSHVPLNSAEISLLQIKPDKNFNKIPQSWCGVQLHCGSPRSCQPAMEAGKGQWCLAGTQ